MISAIQSGFQGMQNASKQVDDAAADISKGNTAAAPQTAAGPAPQPNQSPDIPGDMVGLLLGRATYDANAKVVVVAVKMQHQLDKIV